MTWELHSSDLPFLNDITVSQIKSSYLECFLPYAPLLSAIFSFASIFITLKIANRAREISIEQKKIATDKYDLDMFEKRLEIYQSIYFIYNKIVLKALSASTPNDYYIKVDDKYNDYLDKIRMSQFIFLESDYSYLMEIIFQMNLIKAQYISSKGGKEICSVDKIRYTPEEMKKINLEFRKKWREEYRKGIDRIINKYKPKHSTIFNNINCEESLGPTELPDKPQPIDLKATRARLKRAICEWKKPLQ